MKQRGIYEKVPGSSIWWVLHYDAQGRRRREKAGTKSAAIALYHKRKQEALEGRKLPERLRRAPVGFREIAREALEYSQAYKRPDSHRNDACQMKKLVEWFGDQTAESLGAQEIEKRLAGQMWAPATANRYRALLSLTYRLAIRNGKASTNPIRQVPRRKENNARVRFLDEAEEARLRAKIRESYPEREPEFDLALHTGMRRSEQYGLRWENVNLRLGIITIPCSKHGERRYAPVNSRARAALESLRQQRDGSERLIPRGHGRRWFERAVREAGIVDFHWHDLRHTFASRLVMAGVDLRTVQELLGHKTITMTVRYSHLAPAHLQEAVDRLAEKPTATRTATGADRPFVTEGAYVH